MVVTYTCRMFCLEVKLSQSVLSHVTVISLCPGVSEVENNVYGNNGIKQRVITVIRWKYNDIYTFIIFEKIY